MLIDNIIMLVAHPDDECLWANEIVLHFSRTVENFKVVCLTNADNTVRKNEFTNHCLSVGVECEMLDFPDGGDVVWGEKIQQFVVGLSINSADIIITHSPYGEENGHPQHIQVFKSVAKNALLKKQQAFFADRKIELFNYDLLSITDDLSVYQLKMHWKNAVQSVVQIFYGIFSVRSFLQFKRSIRKTLKQVNLIYDIQRYQFLYEFKVGLEKKHALLSGYQSQCTERYEFYYSPMEYLYSQVKIDGNSN